MKISRNAAFDSTNFPNQNWPFSPPQTEEETRRVTSIPDPEKSSGGYKLYHTGDERESEGLANQLYDGAHGAI
jgi:hypothetical protein